MVQTRGAARARARPISLQDVPYAWLMQLCQGHLGPEELLVLCRTSKWLRELALEMHQGTVTVSCDVRKAIVASRGRLQTALQHSAQVHPIIHGSTSLKSCRAIKNLLSHKNIIKLQPALKISVITLKNLRLDCLVPPGVTEVCPTLVRLELQNCDMANRDGMPVNTVYSATAPQLKELIMRDVRGLNPDHGRAQVLAGLPSLSTVTVLNTGDNLHTAKLQNLSFLGSQLTQLYIPTGASLYQSEAALLLDQVFNRLTVLRIPELNVNSHCMRALVSLAHLRELDVWSFVVYSDFTNSQCNWQRVHITDISVISLPNLPLSNMHHIVLHSTSNSVVHAQGQCSCEHCTLAYLDALATVAGTLESVGRCIELDTPCLTLVCHKLEVLEAVLPLFSLIKGSLKIVDLGVEPSEQQIRTLASRAAPELTALTLDGRTFTASTYLSLLDAMPGLTTLRVQGKRASDLLGPNTVQQLCSRAPRPVTLQCDTQGVPQGFLQTQNAQAAAGTSKVTIEHIQVDYPFGFDSDSDSDDGSGSIPPEQSLSLTDDEGDGADAFGDDGFHDGMVEGPIEVEGVLYDLLEHDGVLYDSSDDDGWSDSELMDSQSDDDHPPPSPPPGPLLVDAAMGGLGAVGLEGLAALGLMGMPQAALALGLPNPPPGSDSDSISSDDSDDDDDSDDVDSDDDSDELDLGHGDSDSGSNSSGDGYSRDDSEEDDDDSSSILDSSSDGDDDDDD